MVVMTEDNTTRDLFDQAREDLHLAQEHSLIKVHAYVVDKEKAKQRSKSKNAERVARFREKQKAAGIAQITVPSTVAEAVKAAGGFSAWLVEQGGFVGPLPPVEVVREVEVPVEVVREVPRAHSVEEVAVMELGRAVAGLSGWRRALVRLISGK